MDFTFLTPRHRRLANPEEHGIIQWLSSHQHQGWGGIWKILAPQSQQGKAFGLMVDYRTGFEIEPEAINRMHETEPERNALSLNPAPPRSLPSLPLSRAAAASLPCSPLPPLGTRWAPPLLRWGARRTPAEASQGLVRTNEGRDACGWLVLLGILQGRARAVSSAAPMPQQCGLANSLGMLRKGVLLQEVA